jgi:nucleoside-diphosphate-sugar epimerase
MKVLVVGGTRFMGVETVERLLERGHDVTLFNRGTRPGLWAGRVRELRGDRTDPTSFGQLAGGLFDGLIDFCAYTARDSEALLRVQGNVPRLVHISSGTVYRLDPRLPWAEETPYGPAEIWGEYARGKIECERVLQAQRSPETATTAVRLPWVLGPRSYADRGAFVLNRLLDHEELLLPGDGKALQQFVSATQAAHSIVAILEQFDRGWRAFNIASPGYASLEGFVHTCAAVAGVAARIRRVGRGATGTGSPVFVMTDAVFPFPNENYLLDLSASTSAGVAPLPTTLEEMLRSELEDLNANPERRRWQRTAAESALIR